MKKEILIFFISIFFIIYSDVCHSQDEIYGDSLGRKKVRVHSEKWDSTPILLIKVNPLLMFSQSEFGIAFEYRFNKSFSWELGGSYNGGTPTLQGGSEHSNGYTLRTGFRVYPKNNFYINPSIFYRYIIYHNRVYDWEKDNSLSGTLETQPCPICGTGTDESYKEFGNENKQVFAIQFLVGWEMLYKKRFPLDIYFGIGYRHKYRDMEIYDYQDLIRNSIWHEIFYSPSQKEVVDESFITLQLGFRFGFGFKLKKSPPN